MQPSGLRHLAALRREGQRVANADANAPRRLLAAVVTGGLSGAASAAATWPTGTAVLDNLLGTCMDREQAAAYAPLAVRKGLQNPPPLASAGLLGDSLSALGVHVATAVAAVTASAALCIKLPVVALGATLGAAVGFLRGLWQVLVGMPTAATFAWPQVTPAGPAALTAMAWERSQGRTPKLPRDAEDGRMPGRGARANGGRPPATVRTAAPRRPNDNANAAAAAVAAALAERAMGRQPAAPTATTASRQNARQGAAPGAAMGPALDGQTPAATQGAAAARDTPTRTAKLQDFAKTQMLVGADGEPLAASARAQAVAALCQLRDTATDVVPDDPSPLGAEARAQRWQQHVTQVICPTWQAGLFVDATLIANGAPLAFAQLLGPQVEATTRFRRQSAADGRPQVVVDSLWHWPAGSRWDVIEKRGGCLPQRTAATAAPLALHLRMVLEAPASAASKAPIFADFFATWQIGTAP